MSKTIINSSMDAIRSAVDYNIEDFYPRLDIKNTIDEQQKILVEHFRSIQDLIFDLEFQIKMLEKQVR